MIDWIKRLREDDLTCKEQWAVADALESAFCEGATREDAMYRFMRHIQDQIEKHAGWMQFDFYVPQIDAYEYNQFVKALGDPKDHARWSDLLERYSARVSEGRAIVDKLNEKIADDSQWPEENE